MVRTTSAVALALLTALPALGLAQEKTRFASLQDALRAGGALAGGSGPRNVEWIEGGRRFSFTIATQGGGEEIRAHDPSTGRDTLLFTASGVTFPGIDQPFEYRSFQWSEDSRHLVFQTRFRPLYRNSGTADYYVYRLADRSLTLAARGARTAELSPNGTMLGYERDGDLFVYDMASGRETRLTQDATETRYHGRFDWVYEEEFGLVQAWDWSPDGRFIASWQLDESAEPVVQFSDFEGRHPEWWRLRIPKPGDTNPTVKIGVVEVRSGRNLWLDPGETGEHYVPRIYWVGRPDTLAVVTLNRPQNEMKLFFFDVNTGGKRLVLTERSEAWLDVYDFFAGVQDLLTFPAGLNQFFWISDRDGWQHIYRYDYAGKLLNQVTRGPWSVTRIEGIDPRAQTIYYTSTQASPVQRQMYAVRFDGSRARRLTQPAGTHDIDMSPDARYYFDRWSSSSQPRQVELWATGGRKLRTFEDNARVSQWVATHAYSPTEIFRFTTSDSVRIDASMVKPVPFDSTRRYPVVFSIYGGPGSQQVYDSWGASTWNQWLAQQGYVVVGVNNRGSNNYGRNFMKIAYQRLGYWEARDFAETARYLSTLRYVDGNRVGIMGTSYGGYTTIYTMEMYPDLFTVGIANSPATDWRLYDTIYTERYMGLLDEAVYDSASAVKHAGNIQGRLMVIHSMMDENVHPQHTMQFLTAAANAGVDVDLRIYPPGRHGAAYNQASAFLIRQATFEYLERHLKGEAGH
jgi:dipeptidyl-peptidase-4